MCIWNGPCIHIHTSARNWCRSQLTSYRFFISTWRQSCIQHFSHLRKFKWDPIGLSVFSHCIGLQPYLRQHHVRDNLNDRGLLTDDGRVVVNVKDYNEFRRYLRYYNVALAVRPVSGCWAYEIWEDCSVLWLTGLGLWVRIRRIRVGLRLGVI